MKKITYILYKIFTKNFDERVKSAKNIQRMLKDSTSGRINHFYDINGNQIRGYSNHQIRSRQVEHPLIAKYK